MVMILVINSGSSSLKLSLLKNEEDLVRLIDVHLKGMNTANCQLEITSAKGVEKRVLEPLNGIEAALNQILNILSLEYGFLPQNVCGIGHRFVHGGSRYISTIQVDDTVMEDLKSLVDLAPLHNEACYLGIKSALKYFGKKIPEFVVFDTAFHASLPDIAANYAIASSLSQNHRIRRYGFHGISNAFLWGRYRAFMKSCTEHSKVVVMHLGNGCSMTAICGGQSVDTSMGFTPAEGLIMGTRAGDIDASIVEFLNVHEKMTPAKVMDELNFHSGLLGISGVSSNMEALLAVRHQNKRAALAIDMFCYRVLKYLGAYIAALGGVDAVIFSGGIGENSATIRNQIIEGMKWLGMHIDEKLNEKAAGLTSGEVRIISSLVSKVPLYVNATDENLFIAREVRSFL
jgi:acetate kinase